MGGTTRVPRGGLGAGVRHPGLRVLARGLTKGRRREWGAAGENGMAPGGCRVGLGSWVPLWPEGQPAGPLLCQVLVHQAEHPDLGSRSGEQGGPGGAAGMGGQLTEAGALVR